MKPHDQWGSMDIAEHYRRAEGDLPRFANLRDGGNLHRPSFDLGVQHVLVGFVLTLLGVGLVLTAVLIAGWL